MDNSPRKRRFERKSSNPDLLNFVSMPVAPHSPNRRDEGPVSTLGAGMEFPFCATYYKGGDSLKKPPWRVKAEHYNLQSRKLEQGYKSEWVAGLMNVLGALVITFKCLWTVRLPTVGSLRQLPVRDLAATSGTSEKRSLVDDNSGLARAPTPSLVLFIICDAAR